MGDVYHVTARDFGALSPLAPLEYSACGCHIMQVRHVHLPTCLDMAVTVQRYPLCR